MRLIDADEFFRNYPELAIEPYINAPTVEPDLKLFKEWKCADCEEREQAYNAGYQKARELNKE